MADHILITPEMSVDTLLSHYPQAARVFVAHGMACVGCPISHLHSLREAAGTYHLGLPAWLDELRAALETMPVALRSDDDSRA